VLTDVTFDAGQFAPAPGAGALPLHFTLTGGTALSLTPPDNGLLTPEDLTVALMYLRAQNEERAEDPDRANVPGPVQP
jgi:hypothetical protein